MGVNMAKTDAKTSRHHVAVLYSSASCGLVREEEEKKNNNNEREGRRERTIPVHWYKRE